MRDDLKKAYDEAPDKRRTNYASPRLPSLEEIDGIVNTDDKVLSVLKCLHAEVPPGGAKGGRVYLAAVAVVTNRTIYIVSAQGLRSNVTIFSEVIPAHTITGVSTVKDLFPYGFGVVVTRAGNIDKFSQLDVVHADKWLAAARELLASGGGGGATNIVQTLDPLDQLKKLKDLLDAGILSQAEFDEKKQALMDKI
jgi:hypothetical protein